MLGIVASTMDDKCLSDLRSRSYASLLEARLGLATLKLKLPGLVLDSQVEGTVSPACLCMMLSALSHRRRGRFP